MGSCVGKEEERENESREGDSSRNLLSEEPEEDDSPPERRIANEVSLKLQELAAAKEAEERHSVARREKNSSHNKITSERGLSIRDTLHQRYQLRDHYPSPTLDFSLKISQLVQACEEHISMLAADGTVPCQSEADALVEELLRLRTHLGPELLPLSMKNAFYREKVSLHGGLPDRIFRLDCIQFFDPILFYGNSVGEPHELVKLYVFLLIETVKSSPFMTLYLERTCHGGEFYHCLCFFCEGNVRGQFHIYGDRCPSYWELRGDVIHNAKQTVEHIASGGVEPLPETICVTVLQTPREPGPINM